MRTALSWKYSESAVGDSEQYPPAAIKRFRPLREGMARVDFS